jgi:hypothetical protein
MIAHRLIKGAHHASGSPVLELRGGVRGKPISIVVIPKAQKVDSYSQSCSHRRVARVVESIIHHSVAAANRVPVLKSLLSRFEEEGQEAAAQLMGVHAVTEQELVNVTASMNTTSAQETILFKFLRQHNLQLPTNLSFHARRRGIWVQPDEMETGEICLDRQAKHFCRITVSKLFDVLQRRANELHEIEDLSFIPSCSLSLVLMVAGDTGGGSCKLIVSFTNSSNPMSARASLLVSMYDGKETYAAVKLVHGPIIQQLNEWCVSGFEMHLERRASPCQSHYLLRQSTLAAVGGEDVEVSTAIKLTTVRAQQAWCGDPSADSHIFEMTGDKSAAHFQINSTLLPHVQQGCSPLHVMMSLCDMSIKFIQSLASQLDAQWKQRTELEALEMVMADVKVLNNQSFLHLSRLQSIRHLMSEADSGMKIAESGIHTCGSTTKGRRVHKRKSNADDVMRTILTLSHQLAQAQTALQSDRSADIMLPRLQRALKAVGAHPAAYHGGTLNGNACASLVDARTTVCSALLPPSPFTHMHMPSSASMFSIATELMNSLALIHRPFMSAHPMCHHLLSDFLMGSQQFIQFCAQHVPQFHVTPKLHSLMHMTEVAIESRLLGSLAEQSIEHLHAVNNVAVRRLPSECHTAEQLAGAMRSINYRSNPSVILPPTRKLCRRCGHPYCKDEPNHCNCPPLQYECDANANHHHHHHNADAEGAVSKASTGGVVVDDTDDDDEKKYADATGGKPTGDVSSVAEEKEEKEEEEEKDDNVDDDDSAAELSGSPLAFSQPPKRRNRCVERLARAQCIGAINASNVVDSELDPLPPIPRSRDVELDDAGCYVSGASDDEYDHERKNRTRRARDIPKRKKKKKSC